ncbi:MAG: GMC family oxidoreductase [Rhizobiaceae bacterium]
MTAPASADIIFVGSGIAAALAGATIAKAGFSVLFLEAGPRVDRGTAVTRFQFSSSKGQNSPYPDQPYAPQPEESDFSAYYVEAGPQTFRGQQARIVGGTTWHWGGLAARFRPNDFKMRTKFGVGVDWPISYEDVEPWYQMAEEEIGVAGDDDADFGAPRSKPFPMPPIPMTYADKQVGIAARTLGYSVLPFPQARNSVWRDGRPQCCGNASCVPICPIQAKYDATHHLGIAERAGAHVEPQAVVHQLVVGPDKSITEVRYRRPDKSEGVATGKIVVIAAHTVETPKLLLMSAGDNAPTGVANSSDQVGRNLLSQIDVGIQGLTKDPVFTYRGPVSTGGIAELRDGDFRNEHAAIGISPSNEGWTRAVGPFQAATTFIKQGLRGDALKAAVRSHVARELIIGSSAEMLPDADNRVTLSDELDGIGIPRPKIAFKSDDYTARGLAVARDVQNRLMAALGATQLKQLGPIADSAIMGGTTRMGDDPKTSVVDRDLRSHDHPNLYIVGSATFPTITANAPTLTIAAMSARLGAHLTSVLKA